MSPMPFGSRPTRDISVSCEGELLIPRVTNAFRQSSHSGRQGEDSCKESGEGVTNAFRQSSHSGLRK